MNPTVRTQLGHADPNVSPITINDLIDLLNQLFSSEILGSYIPYVIGNATPGVDDRDKAWMELDTQGRPISTKIFYNGTWRRVYNGMIGEVRGYSGDPSIDFDTHGKGLIGQQYDGWQLCNGRNGSPNYSDKFMIGGHMDNSGGHVGYDNGWQTFVDGKTDLKNGGNASNLITAPFLPPLDLQITGNEAQEAASLGDQKILVDRHHTATEHTFDVGNIYGANPGATPPTPQVPFPVLPPFIAYGLIIFQGYN